MVSPNVYRLALLAFSMSVLGIFWLFHATVTSRMEATLEAHGRRFDEVVKEVRKLRDVAMIVPPTAVPSDTPDPTPGPTCPPTPPTTPPPPPPPPPPSQTNKRIAILSMNVGNNGGRDWIYPMSFRNRLLYSKKWNVDLIVEGNELVDTTRDVCWSKIPMIKEWLPHYDWLMWMDGDAFFMDMEKSLESVLDDTKDFIVAKDWNDINLGIFFIKNSKYTMDLLQEMWDVPRDRWAPFEEQSALHHLTSLSRNEGVAKRHLPHFAFPAQRTFNSYPEEFSYGNIDAKYQPGDFIAHFPNCRNIGSCQNTISRVYTTVNKVDLKRVPPVYFPAWSKKGMAEAAKGEIN